LLVLIWHLDFGFVWDLVVFGFGIFCSLLPIAYWLLFSVDYLLSVFCYNIKQIKSFVKFLGARSVADESNFVLATLKSRLYKSRLYF